MTEHASSLLEKRAAAASPRVLCPGDGCDRREACVRFRSRYDGTPGVWFAFAPMRGGECAHFVPGDERAPLVG